MIKYFMKADNEIRPKEPYVNPKRFFELITAISLLTLICVYMSGCCSVVR